MGRIWARRREVEHHGGRGALVLADARLGIPEGVHPRQAREGSPALLLGTQSGGPQLFTAPTDGVIVNATDTQRLMHTHDADVIGDILKRAGVDRHTLEAMTSAPHRELGGPVTQGQTYTVNEQGRPEAMVPNFKFSSVPANGVNLPGVTRGADGTYNITIGDTHVKVEAGTTGHTKGINDREVHAIVERKQAELVSELTKALQGG